MSLRRGGGWGGGGWDTALQDFYQLHERPNRPYLVSFLAVTPQNAAKSIPNINIHLAVCFQPVGHLSANTRAIKRAAVRSWTPDRPQKQAMGKAD